MQARAEYEEGCPDICFYLEQLMACIGSTVVHDDEVFLMEGPATLEAPSTVLRQQVWYMKV